MLFAAPDPLSWATFQARSSSNALSLANKYSIYSKYNLIKNNSVDCFRLGKAKEFKKIKIIRYEESVYYANVDNFKYKIFKLANVDPVEIMHSINKEYHKECKKLDKLHAIQVIQF